MNDDIFNALISEIVSEWNSAEKAIKHAENVDGEVIIPSINELRYAGRRIVDALHAKNTDLEKAVTLLRDAKFDCHRAKHDAVDAATSKMIGDLSAALEYLTANVVMANFQSFSRFYKNLTTVRQKIAISRENREDREIIYDTILSVDLDGLIQDYNEFTACEPLMVKIADQQRAADTRNKIYGAAGIISLIIGVPSFSILVYEKWPVIAGYLLSSTP